MTATLERRVAQLEAEQPPPPDEPGDDDLRWFHEARGAVRAYFLAVEQELAEHYAGEAEPDAEAIVRWVEVRHPLYWSVRFAAEQGYSLRRTQHHLLCDASRHLQHTLDAHPPGTIADTAWRRGFGIDAKEGGRRYADHLGAGLVEAWRAHRARGEPCPSFTHYMGVEHAERDLLDADE